MTAPAETLEEVIERCWRGGMGLRATALAVKRNTGRAIDCDTIQRHFARHSSQ